MVSSQAVLRKSKTTDLLMQGPNRILPINIDKFDCNPIITPQMDHRLGDNINGPSLIRVPDWIPNPLGRYYLYFGHHQGTYIRMAYADHLKGPWRIYQPGVLDLTESYFSNHIASPDVHVLDEDHEIRMYYHGGCVPRDPDQVTRLAISSDGLHFRVQPEILGSCYWRVFNWDNYVYTLEMPGKFLRSRNGHAPFVEGPTLFTPAMRHAAVKVEGNTLHVFYSNAGDCPEGILWSRIELKPDWHTWKVTPPVKVTSPELDWEGADCPITPSKRWAAPGRVHQLRDPCLFSENGKTYLLYAVAGESGIALTELST
jgi:hypothetical protein